MLSSLLESAFLPLLCSFLTQLSCCCCFLPPSSFSSSAFMLINYKSSLRPKHCCRTPKLVFQYPHQAAYNLPLPRTYCPRGSNILFWLLCACAHARVCTHAHTFTNKMCPDNTEKQDAVSLCALQSPDQQPHLRQTLASGSEPAQANILLCSLAITRSLLSPFMRFQVCFNAFEFHGSQCLHFCFSFFLLLWVMARRRGT